MPSRPPPQNVIGDNRVVGNVAAMVSSILAAVERNAPQRVYVEQARKYAEKAATGNAREQRAISYHGSRWPDVVLARVR